jgi:hypothetical protein
MPNFIVHGRPGARTDVDVLAVRLEHSQEAGFQDDKGQLRTPDRGTDVVLAEAKEGCVDRLNGPWANREGRALDYVLKRVGVVPPDQVERVASELYSKRNATGDGFTVRVCAFGESVSKDVLSQGVTFVSWKSVFEFVHRRFLDNSQFKRDNVCWDDSGKYLWQKVESCTPTDCKRFFQNWDDQKA